MAGRKRVGVYPHGNSGWRIQVKDPLTGKWKQVVATAERFRELGVPLRGLEVTKTDAARLREKYEDLLRQSAALGPVGGERTLGEAEAEYLRFQRNAEDFLNTKKRVLKEFRQVVGDQALHEIAKPHLRRYEDFLRGTLAGQAREGEKLGQTSVARYLRYVRTFFNSCVREGWILRSPFVNYPIPGDESTPIERYTLKEIEELVAWIRGIEGRGYVEWMVAGFLGLGLRSMELQALDWSSFDAKERFVRIEKTKNPESRRLQSVPLSLMSLFEARQKEAGPMFPTQSGDQASRNQMGVLGRRIAKKRPGFAWSRLRRTYATLLQVAGVDSLIIDRLLGHSSKSSAIRVSARHYIGKEYAFYRSLVDEALAPLGPLFAVRSPVAVPVAASA